MSDTTTPAAVTTFNSKVADLVKQAQPNDLAEILKHPSSLLRAADNQNQNQGGRSRE